MNANDLFKRNRPQRERIILLQVLFVNYGKVLDIPQGADIIRTHTGLIKFLLVKWRMVIRVGNGPFQAVKLNL